MYTHDKRFNTGADLNISFTGFSGIGLKLFFQQEGRIFSLKITMTYIDTTFSSNYTIKDDVLWLLRIATDFV